MAKIVVLGEEIDVGAFALAGAIVIPAEDPAAVRSAWSSLPDDVAVVVMTPAAAAALPAQSIAARGDVLTVTMP